MSRDLVGQTTDDILDRIISGQFTPGDPLPPEADLASLLEISRPTLREAVKILKDRGVLRVVHGRGTYVAPPSRWRDIDTVLELAARTLSPRDFGLRLTEVRRMLEVGAAGLAATNRTDEDLELMELHLAEYDDAVEQGNIGRATTADIEFHNDIMRASGNPLISIMLTPLEKALVQNRYLTTADPVTRERARAHHVNLFKTIKEQRPEAAKNAMREHMTQTRLDIARL